MGENEREKIMTDIQTQIKEIVEKNPVVIFMKGNPEAPQCGFSAQSVKCLMAAGAKNLKSVNVLENPQIRHGIKEFTQWPTIPQIFIKGKFIGGCDIVSEMFENGELQTVVKEALG